MTGVANINLQLRFGTPGGERVSATTGNFGFDVFRMNPLFHGYFSFDCLKDCLTKSKRFTLLIFRCLPTKTVFLMTADPSPMKAPPSHEPEEETV